MFDVGFIGCTVQVSILPEKVQNTRNTEMKVTGNLSCRQLCIGRLIWSSRRWSPRFFNCSQRPGWWWSELGTVRLWGKLLLLNSQMGLTAFACLSHCRQVGRRD